MRQPRRPMMYQPLEDLERIYACSQESSSTSPRSTTSLLPPSPVKLIEQLHDAKNDSKRDPDPFLTVAVALLYLSHGGPDVCHALVTPLSWHEATHFSGPPPIMIGTTPIANFVAAQAAATYAHMLLHRWEGSNVGEWGLSGYSNAHYWGKATLARRQPSLIPILEQIRQRMERLIHEDTVGGAVTFLSERSKQAGRDWMEEWIVSEFPNDPLGWEPRALTELCQSIERSSSISSSSAFSTNPAQTSPLVDFAATACWLECQVLMEHCWQCAGYDIPVTSAASMVRNGSDVVPTLTDLSSKPSVPKSILDIDDAIRASKRVSSAHLNVFRQTGSIVVRGAGSTKSVALGIACRLLEVPACQLLPMEDHNIVVATATTTTTNNDQCQDSRILLLVFVCLVQNQSATRLDGYDLNPGDVWVSRFPPANETVLQASSAHQVLQVAACETRPGVDPLFQSCGGLYYEDPFYGARGETPTTVIQWSKGTIF